jgi:hypothetical protein
MENGGSKQKIRGFDFRDLLLLQRLQTQGQALDYETARVDGVFPLRDALQNYLLLGSGSCQTLVLPGMDAFVQYVRPKGSNRVQLTYLAPVPASDERARLWVDLLEQLVATVGSQGVHHIVAEANADGPEIELLQQAGFGVFTRQILLRLACAPEFADGLPAVPGLRTWRSTDEWGVRLLYANTVPQMVQQIESSGDSAFFSSRWPHRWVLERDGEIIAGLAARRGRVGSAIRLLLHPEADVYVETLIRYGLGKVVGEESQPVYCRVRRYEGWLQAPLEASGFQPMARTALLVKHTVARVMTPEWQRVRMSEGQAEITTPVPQARFQNR